MKRIQNKIALSRLSLPTTAFLALLVWIAGGVIEQKLWLQLACFVLSSYIMVELNTTFVLLRTYSRMVSCVFIVLSCCASFLFNNSYSSVATLCFVASLMPLFKSYQDKESVGWTFYAFIPLGAASLLWAQMLFLVPIAWVLMATCLRSFSLRTLMASVLGILTPYWFALVYFVYTKDYNTPLEHFRQLADLGPITACSTADEYFSRFSLLGFERLLCLAFAVILFVTGFVHFFRNRFQDKLNTRMFYDIFITYGFLLLTGIILQPQHFDMLFHLLIVCTSPLAAHYITHTKTYITNISFIVMCVAALAIIVLNIII